MTSTEVATVDTTDMSAILAKYAADIPIIPVESNAPDDISSRIADQILNAGSVADIAALFGDRGTETYMNQEFTVTGFTLHESNYKGQQVYAEINVTMNGKAGVFSTGARGIIVTLVALHVKGWLPQLCTLREHETRSGNTVRNLVPVV